MAIGFVPGDVGTADIDMASPPATRGSQARNSFKAKQDAKRRVSDALEASNAARSAVSSDIPEEDVPDIDMEEPPTGGGGAASVPESAGASGSGGGNRGCENISRSRTSWERW